MKHLIFEEIGSISGINDLRSQYLDELFEAQEQYLELLVRNSKIFIIESHDRRIGYFLLGEGATLLEYYVIQANIDQVDTLLGEIIQVFSIQKALCKSFDHTFLSCCMRFQKKVNVVGIHFREYEEKRAFPIPKGITIRLAKTEDEPGILEINEEVFEQAEEVGEYIRKNQILLFAKDEGIIGFGIFARVIEGKPEFDIGMLVNRKYRRQGYGEFIVHSLVDYCKQHGWRAICGCAIENEGSRRCLEKVGFTGRYRLLEFVF